MLEMDQMHELCKASFLNTPKDTLFDTNRECFCKSFTKSIILVCPQECLSSPGRHFLVIQVLRSWPDSAMIPT